MTISEKNIRNEFSKYTLLKNDKIVIDGHTLYRIKYNNGELGGYIESYKNLSIDPDDSCSIYDDAKVYGNAQVLEDAFVYNNAEIFDNAVIRGDSQVYGNAKIYGNAEIYDNAEIFEDARVFQLTKVYGNAIIRNNSKVCGDSKIYGSAFLAGEKICNQTIFKSALEENIKGNKQIMKKTIKLSELKEYIENRVQDRLLEAKVKAIDDKKITADELKLSKAHINAINIFAENMEQISKLTAEIKKIEAKANIIEDKIIIPLLESLKALEKKSLLTNKTLINISKYSYEKSSASYQKAFNLALTKVNDNTKKVLEDALEATRSITQAKASYTATKLKEATFANTIKQLYNKINSYISYVIKGINKLINVDYNQLNSTMNKLLEYKK